MRMTHGGLRVYLYVPAERRLVLADLAWLPAAGEPFAYGGRRYRVAAVHAGQRPAILSLESGG